jgi:hypothetical protein
MYDPKLNPLNVELKKKIKAADWDKVTPMLIGFDVYVDVDGNVGFYEGNSIPFALGDYRGMFGGDLEEAIVKILKKVGKVGINVDLETEEAGCVSYNGGVARDICRRNNIPFVMGSAESNMWDDKKKKFYFDRPTGREYFDFLFNRRPGAQRILRERVQVEDWGKAHILSPMAHTLLLANKDETSRALIEFGLESPLAFVVNNYSEAKAAAQNVMQHIKQNHPNYQAPFILVKPRGGTGARGVRVFLDENSLPSGLKYPCLVGERITVQPYQGHAIDTRMFYCNGFASHGIGRAAPNSISSAKGNEFDASAIITNLCQGGSATRLSPGVEKIYGEYVLAAALAIDKGAKKLWKGRCTAQN